jgi:hypothetical protein
VPDPALLLPSWKRMYDAAFPRHGGSVRVDKDVYLRNASEVR